MAKLFPFPSPEPDPNPIGRIPDAAERLRALDIRRSWIVEAPAGSGKTGLLIQRMLRLLADESVSDPGQVLAITFTIKATNEMRERIAAQLQAAAAGEEPRNPFDRETRSLAEQAVARDRERGWGLLENPRRLAIRTIDSVCAGIARSLPVLSGAGGGQAPVADASELFREAARRTLMLLGGSDHALTAAIETVMLHRDGNFTDCERLLAEMLQWRDQWGELVPLGAGELDDTALESEVLPRIERALELAVCQALTHASRVMPGDLLEDIAVLAGELADGDAQDGPEWPLAICRRLKSAPGDAAEDLSHWRALSHLLLTKGGEWRAEKGIRRDYLKLQELQKHHAAQLKAILARLRGEDAALNALCALGCLPPARYPREQWVVTKALFRMLSRALVELQIVFSERGECDFTEVGLLARGALRQEAGLEDLTTANGSELRHLLVDEMQDTSTSQYELIQLLTESFDGHSQTVFLVGDPKQSIYLFRQARVERFVRTMLSERLGEIPLGCLRLTANFRSQRGLVEAFNDDFSLIFPAAANRDKSEDVPYVRAQPVRTETDAAGEVWHTEAIPYSDDRALCAVWKRESTRANAREIRAVAQAWRSRPLPPGRTEPWKIAILVRSRLHLTEIVAEFKLAAIPFRAVEIEILGERHEILDLVALTRALLHPADRVAWFAILRAPWCGLTLDDLHRLAGQDDPAWKQQSLLQLLDERGHELSPDGCLRLERLWAVMLAAARKRGTLPLAEWVERTWRSLGAEAFSTAEERANVQRYFNLLEELEEPGGVLRIPVLKQRLAKLYAEASAHPGAVDLMTIHGAKGLEWDVVMVPGLERTGQSSRGRLLNWMELEEGGGDVAHGILAPIAGKGEASRELNEWMKSVATAREAAERKRLFYVACTRAREELHLFASPAEKKDGGVSVPANTLLASAWPAVERRFARPAALPDSIAARLQKDLLAALDLDRNDRSEGFAMAASAVASPPKLQRIPSSFTPASIEVKLPYGHAGERARREAFDRPEGSFASRAFGNAMHTFLELMAARLKDGQSPGSLSQELSGWQPRVAAVLRAAGLPLPGIDRTATRVLLGLSNTLRDPIGLWTLAAHPDAASEQEIVSTTGRIRVDRTFVAGPEPLSTGQKVRWIVDFKTGTHGREGVETFLALERTRHEGQMQTYAQASAWPQEELRAGLYYPLLSRLIWWIPQN